jgi:hypothetical protein
MATPKLVRAQVVFWAVAIAVTGAVLVLRRPDAVFHAQFWAEDGVVWYADAYNLGALQALLRPRDGYIQTLPRLAAGVALWAPLLRAPLVMNLLALLIQALPALFLVSPRMRKLGPLSLRSVLALLYLLVPDASELHATITDSEFHLAVLACLLLIAATPRSHAGRVFDVAVLVLFALTGPFCVLLVPVALALSVAPLLRAHPRFHFRTSLALSSDETVGTPVQQSAPAKLTAGESRWRWVQLSLLAGGGLLQGLIVLATGDARFDTVLGASVGRFARIVAGQIILPVFLGPNRLYHMFDDPRKVTLVAFLLTVLAALAFLYGLLRGSVGLRCFIFFCLSVLAAALVFPTYEPVHYQWDVFLVPGWGLRYWYLPKLALMATLIWLLGRHRPAPLRLLAAVLACMMVFAIAKQWRYPPEPDFQFATYVRVFEQLPPGKTSQIDLLPGGKWVMKLVKR